MVDAALNEEGNETFQVVGLSTDRRINGSPEIRKGFRVVGVPTIQLVGGYSSSENWPNTSSWKLEEKDPFEQFIGIASIHKGEFRIDFKDPILLTYRYEPSTRMHIIENSELNIICSNESYEECYDEVEDEITVLWKEIVQTEDSKLTPDAIKLKRYLLSLKK
jgi:hypothetical protein